MRRLVKRGVAIAAGATLAAGLVATVDVASADSHAPAPRVTICHIAGHAQPNNANEVEITISENGLRGHFDEGGTDAAGHEWDSRGPCNGQPI